MNEQHNELLEAAHRGRLLAFQDVSAAICRGHFNIRQQTNQLDQIIDIRQAAKVKAELRWRLNLLKEDNVEAVAAVNEIFTHEAANGRSRRENARANS